MKPDDQIHYINAHLQRPVVIIGMMGAGKTTLARRLSSLLDWEFVDSDLEIENEENISVKEMFETRGEVYFRGKEKQKIAQLLSLSRKIISVGGGAITSPETAEAIFSRSLSLWVDAPIKILAKRTSGQGSRPLLNGKNVEEALAERMEQRLHLYSRAHIHVDGSHAVDDVAYNALGQIYNYLIEKTDEI